jgi:mono/diheme cytochrome c family protein
MPKPDHSAAHRPATLLAALALGAGACAIGACHGERSNDPPRQFLPDMDDSPKFKPQTETEFFADGRAMRQWVPGTIAFGEDTSAQGEGRERFLREDGAFYRGYEKLDDKGEPVFLDTMPGGIAVTKEYILHGRERFNIYCSACHGYLGDGQGTVGRQWASPVANFHDPKYLDRALKTGKDGYIFHTILNGVPAAVPGEASKMPAYAGKVSEADAWAIVAYVRTLQAVWVTDLATIPADKRQQMDPTRPPAPPPEPPSAAPGTQHPVLGTPGTPSTPSVPAPAAPGGSK